MRLQNARSFLFSKYRQPQQQLSAAPLLFRTPLLPSSFNFSHLCGQVSIQGTSDIRKTMKTNLDLVADCDLFPADRDASHFYSFLISPYTCPLGYMLESTVNKFSWSDDWIIDNSNRTVTLRKETVAERNAAMASILKAEQKKGSFKVLGDWRDEMFPIFGPDHELMLSMERTGAQLFGITTYGVQLLAYEDRGGEIKVWIAKRAKNKRRFPGLLDSTVGGSLPTGETPFECLLRESGEEASIPERTIREYAKACGTLNYIHVSDERGGGEHGLISPEVQYLYEMQLPKDIELRPRDGEVEKFMLCTVDDLRTKLEGGEFTPANGCVVLDLFIRHGIITAELEKDYVKIVSRLHRSLPFPTA